MDVYRISEIALGNWPAQDRRRPAAEPQAQFAPPELPRRFNLLRWISIFGFIAIFVVSMANAGSGS